jgi:hypothetical protein
LLRLDWDSCRGTIHSGSCGFLMKLKSIRFLPHTLLGIATAVGLPGTA